MMKIVVPLMLTVALAACNGDSEVSDPEDVAAFTYRERIVKIHDSVNMWENADTVADAHAAAEATANLVVGSGGPDFGDRDGNGTIGGDTEFGVLPGLDGTPTGLANALDDNECIIVDVLGGAWDDPEARWDEMQTVVGAWTPENNTMPNLASHPMRIVGWAMLALDSDSLDGANEFAGRAQLNVDVSLDAVDC